MSRFFVVVVVVIFLSCSTIPVVGDFVNNNKIPVVDVITRPIDAGDYDLNNSNSNNNNRPTLRSGRAGGWLSALFYSFVSRLGKHVASDFLAFAAPLCAIALGRPTEKKGGKRREEKKQL